MPVSYSNSMYNQCRSLSLMDVPLFDGNEYFKCKATACFFLPLSIYSPSQDFHPRVHSWYHYCEKCASLFMKLWQSVISGPAFGSQLYKIKGNIICALRPLIAEYFPKLSLDGPNQWWRQKQFPPLSPSPKQIANSSMMTW